MNYTVVLEEAEEGGYTVTVPALPGCISEGDDYDDALENIKDAIQLYLRAVAKEVQQLKKQKKLETRTGYGLNAASTTSFRQTSYSRSNALALKSLINRAVMYICIVGQGIAGQSALLSLFMEAKY